LGVGGGWFLVNYFLYYVKAKVPFPPFLSRGVHSPSPAIQLRLSNEPFDQLGASFCLCGLSSVPFMSLQPPFVSSSFYLLAHGRRFPFQFFPPMMTGLINPNNAELLEGSPGALTVLVLPLLIRLNLLVGFPPIFSLDFPFSHLLYL